MHRQLLMLALVIAPSCATAQANPDSVKLRNDCRLAEQVMTTGHPAPRLEWAAWSIARCSAPGPVIATAMSRLRTSKDTALLNLVSVRASVVRDRSIFNTALSILADRSASEEAQIFSMRALAWLYSPGGPLNYSDFVDTDGDGEISCYGSGPPMDLSLVRGGLLPSNWQQTIREAARQVEEGSTESDTLRRAAGCFRLMQPDPILRRLGVEDA